MLDSQGWGHQAIDTTPETTNQGTGGNGIARGTVTVDSSTSDTGGKSVKVSLPARDSNTYRSTAAQFLRTRKPDVPGDSWYSLAFRIGAGMVVPTDQPSTLMSTNYQDPTGQWAVGMSTVNGVMSLYSLVNGGFSPGGVLTAPYYSGTPVGGGYSPRPEGMPGPLYLVQAGQMQFDTWYEEIYHVHSALDNTGSVEAWIRKKGDPSFVLAYSYSGFPTFMWTDSGGWTSSAILANTPTTTDKFGLYIASTNFERHAWFDSICRATTFEAARSCLP